jgi:hypothetical protein
VFVFSGTLAVVGDVKTGGRLVGTGGEGGAPLPPSSPHAPSVAVANAIREISRIDAIPASCFHINQ